MYRQYQLKKYGLPAVVGGFLTGVTFGAYFNGGVYAAAALLLTAIALVGIYRLRERSIIILLACVFVACTAVGLVRHSFAAADSADPLLAREAGNRVKVTGIISSEVQDRRQYQRVVVSPETLNTNLSVDANSRILIYAPHFPDIVYGDRITITGELTVPTAFESETGRTFPYPQFLKKDDIYFEMSYPDITKVSSGHGNILKDTLLDIKSVFLTRINQLVPEPNAALLGGVTVGARSALGKSLEQQFRDTGLIHIVVLSGFNVTIVAEAMMRLLSFLPMLIRGLFGGGAIVLFALLTGASATIVRASIMAILVIIARAFGRTYQIIRALVLAAALMVLVNPLILRFDPSFQLSFLASFGLIYLGPLMDRLFQVVPSLFQLREYATATVATQLFVTPLLIFMIGRVPLVSLPVNLLSLPAVPVSMLLGLLTAVAGFVSTSFAQLFAMPAFGFTEYILGIVRIFSNTSFTTVAIPQISGWIVIAAYVIFGVLVWLFHRWVGGVDARVRNKTDTYNIS